MSTAVPSINFEEIPSYKPRAYVPQDADLTNLDQIKSTYEELTNREIGDHQAFETWILERSEFEAALDQAGSILYIRMTCQTDNESYAQAYQEYIKNISPVVSAKNHALNQKFENLTTKYPLDEETYGILQRGIKEDLALFREENIPLATQVSLLGQEYQTISGAMTVTFEGEERTLPQMSKYLLEPDRDLRERAWRATAERRLQDQEKLDQLFDKMLKLRVQIAKNAGCQNFVEYKFRSLHRFDYTPEDCKQYHQTIKEVVLPVWKKIMERRKTLMKLEKLRPWDTSVDPQNLPPLKPFEKVDELIEGCQTIFQKVDRELGDKFSQMAETGLLDLASRKGKAPGGYQSCLSEARKPFIFMNAVGVDQDVRTLLHEAGHAFHSLGCSHFDLLDYRHGPMEFNEVASMAMELLGGNFLIEFYSEEDAKRSVREHTEDVVFILIWVALIDAFQHWMYENPEHTPGERRTQWLEMYESYSGQQVQWDGLEDVKSYLWHRQLHIFEVPFYYIEYGIAQLGALQLWLNSLNDWGKAVDDYKEALALGGSRPLPELYQRAGIRFDFSKETIEPIMKRLDQELS